MNQYYKYYIALTVVIVLNALACEAESIEIAEKLSQKVPPDIWLIDEHGNSINLLDEIRIPTVLNFVNFSCHKGCILSLDEIKNVLGNSELEPGTDYQFITLSINPRKTLHRADSIKSHYAQGISNMWKTPKGWRFFTGDSINIKKALTSLGYSYKNSGEGIIHKVCYVVTNSSGMIVRYSLGTKLLPQEIQISVTEGEKGLVLPTIYKKDEYCFPHVAPAFSRLNKITGQIGIIMIISALLFFLYLIVPLNQKK